MIGFALLLRLVNLQLLGWVPDTYERLEMTERLLRGDFPLSTITPPGIAVVLAPFFAVLPRTLETMQAVTIGAGVALVGLAYAGVLRSGGDRLTAFVLAALVAIGPRFVYASRDAFYDGLVLLLLAASVFLVPSLRGRRLAAYIAYGCLLALLVNIRPTNAVVLPAVVLYRLYDTGALWPLTRVARSLLSREVLATLATIAFLTGLSVWFGGWLGRASGAPVTIDELAGNVRFYALSLLPGAAGKLFFAPLALGGMARLWRLNRGLLLATLVVLVGWPLAYAPFPFHDVRYMLPATFFVYVLVAFGVRQLWVLATSMRMPGRPLVVSYVGLAVLTICGSFALGSARIVGRWDVIAAESDEGLARTFAPALARLRNEPVVVTAAAQALRTKTLSVAYVDLVAHWLENDSDRASQQLLTGRVQEALSAGHDVYYLYTHWEEGDDFHGGSDGFYGFFESLQSRYLMIEVYRSEADRLGRYPWILYGVQAP